MEGLSLVISGIVTIAVTGFGYLSLKLKMQAQGHEARIKTLELHKEQCEKDLKESRQELETPWPSDHDDFQSTVLTVKKAYERSGQILTMRDAMHIARRMLDKKKNNDTKIDVNKEGGL